MKLFKNFDPLVFFLNAFVAFWAISGTIAIAYISWLAIINIQTGI